MYLHTMQISRLVGVCSHEYLTASTCGCQIYYFREKCFEMFVHKTQLHTASKNKECPFYSHISLVYSRAEKFNDHTECLFAHFKGKMQNDVMVPCLNVSLGRPLIVKVI